MQSIMGRAWASSGMWHGWVTTVYVHIKLQLSKSKRRHSLGFGWKRATKCFWTSRASWRLQCSHVCNDILALNGTLLKEWQLWQHIGCCTLISILSPRGFQLPTICVGWCFSAVMLFHLGFQLLTLRAGWFLSAVNYLQSLLGVLRCQSVSHLL